MSYIKTADGIDLIFEPVDSFKTKLISFNFYTPIVEKECPAAALLPALLVGGTPDCPDYAAVSHRLDMLYGADISSKVHTRGDVRHSTIQLSYIDDKYTSEKTEADAVDFLFEVVFQRFFRNFGFNEKELLREKRILKEQIESIINNKRAYARRQASRLIFKGEPSALPVLGEADTVENVTEKELISEYEKLLKNARVRVVVVGNDLPDGFEAKLRDTFGKVGRCYLPLPDDTVTAVCETETVIEKMPVNQGKIVLGYASGKGGRDFDTLPLFVMSDLFGGGVYSKLFKNVREKQSLCYYCVASAVRSKGVLVVDSGVEAKNSDKLISSVTHELDAVKNGDFSSEDLDCCLRSLSDELNALKDSQYALEAFHSSRFRDETAHTIDEFIAAINRVTADDIRAAANSLKLKTVYMLLPETEEKK